MIRRTSCRVCSGILDGLLSLGEHFVSNFPSPGESDGIAAPLDLAICQSCGLVQLQHTVPADTMYRNYWYMSGTNESMRKALADISDKAEVLMHLQPGDAVLDIGCNDGTLLSSYRTRGLYKIGFDPAENLAPRSRQIADKHCINFFSADTYVRESELTSVRPRVVTSIAMFYDLEHPRDFVESIKKVMHTDGVWIVQMSYLGLMLRQNAFDNICHEHLEYYSLKAFESLVNLYDFEVVDVELNDVNGGSFRLYVRSREANRACFGDETYRHLAAERVAHLQSQETVLALGDRDTYAQFALWVRRIKEDVVSFIRDAVQRGKKVCVYGASTKGNTLLQYFGLDHSVITAAAERNPDKWGRVTVGTHIPIISEKQARELNPDYFLVLPWHFLEEFKKREAAYLSAGGRFIVPAPHFSLI